MAFLRKKATYLSEVAEGVQADCACVSAQGFKALKPSSGGRAGGYSECNQSSRVLFCCQDGMVGSGAASATFSSARRFISRLALA